MNVQTIRRRLEQYEVVLEPDKNVPEWWAGAPSALAAEGRVFLAARLREGDSPRGLRGYEIRILESIDGRLFDCIAQIRREDAALRGFERPALVRDPESGRYRLYVCAPVDGHWQILLFDDAEHPGGFNPTTAAPVLAGADDVDGRVRVTGYKDPFVFWDDGRWHMLVIGIDRVERIHHFVSVDGRRWERGLEAPVLENTGWHNFYTRPACVLPLDAGYLLVYEGSHFGWHDPVYNIASGLAYSPDLFEWHDLTPDRPLLMSTTPGRYHTWRYSHWLRVGGALHVYYEAARANDTNEIRVGILPLTAL
jgi:hypothetical protein